MGRVLEFLLSILLVLVMAGCLTFWILGLFHPGPLGHTFASAAGVCGLASGALAILLGLVDD